MSGVSGPHVPLLDHVELTDETSFDHPGQAACVDHGWKVIEHRTLGYTEPYEKLRAATPTLRRRRNIREPELDTLESAHQIDPSVGVPPARCAL